MCLSDKMMPFQNDIASMFFRLSKVWGMLHHELFVHFHYKICVFIIFIAVFQGSIKFLWQNIKQSETGIGGPKSMLWFKF